LGACLGISHAADLDTALQGRLLQRSDGVAFVYKDGAKYAVQSADLSDDEIDAIPNGSPPTLDALFAATTPRANAPPSTPPQTSAPPAPVASTGAPLPAPQLPAGINLVNLTGSLKVAIPSPLSVTTQQDGRVYMANNLSGQEIDVFVVGGANTADAVLQSARGQYEAATHLAPSYDSPTDIQPAGRVTQVRAVPFKVQFTNSLGLQFASGSMLAVMRPDVSIAIAYTQLDIGSQGNGSPLDLVLASLEQ
jgi:hypothetical protein